MLEEAHGIDSTRFHLVANHLDTKKDQHRAASEYRFSWASEAYSVVDARSACGSVQCRLGWPCREVQGSSDRDAVCAVLRRTEPARDRNEPAEPRGQTLPSRRPHHIAIGALHRQCFASCGGLCRPAFGPDGSVAGRLSTENRRLRSADRFDQRAAEQPERQLGYVFGGRLRRPKAHFPQSPLRSNPDPFVDALSAY